MDNNNLNNTIISSNDPSSTSAAATTTAPSNSNNRDQFLRHLNKLSHKISKPTFTPSTSTLPGSSVEPTPVHPPQQQQPPVYNINKSQFRDVVQKLTGSPAHATTPPPQPPPIHAPKPASSRLQRIRPPPLAQLTTRPPPLLNSGVNPLSPLPPLPTCHAAADSPISAYMKFFHSSVASGSIFPPPLPTCHAAADSPISAYMKFFHSSVASGSIFPPPQAPTADATANVPPFGYFPSPKSPCPLLSPNLVFSPTGNGTLGFPQLPASPTVPGVPSPKWRDL